VKDWTNQAAPIDLAALEKEIAERDERDSTRADSPLVAAPDAVIMPTDGFSIEQVIARIAQIIEDRAIAAATP
jgi:cytidylate kinase